MEHEEGTEAGVRAAAADQARARAILRAATKVLHRRMRKARDNGATVKQLMAWTGLKRRRVFQILKA